MTRPTIVAGNWKLNPRREEGLQLYREICEGLTERSSRPEGVWVVFIPPLPYLGALTTPPRVFLGAQDVSTRPWGAFTGEVGAPLLADFGIRYVLVGHSERRHLMGESEAEVGEKTGAVVAAGLTPILCVGELEKERDAEETFSVIERQLSTGLRGVPPEAPIVIAYEPVWAIGTGRTATPEMVVEVHRFIRKCLSDSIGEEQAEEISILYGGSVNPSNAAALLQPVEIDGALVGGASLMAEGFLSIIDSAGKTVSQ